MFTYNGGAWVAFDRFKNHPIVLAVKHQNDMSLVNYTVDTAPRGVSWKNRQATIHKYFSLPLFPYHIDLRETNKENKHVE